MRSTIERALQARAQIDRYAVIAGLLALQRERKLRVWIDADRITVARWTELQDDVRDDRESKTWRQALDIVTRGALHG